MSMKLSSRSGSSTVDIKDTQRDRLFLYGKICTLASPIERANIISIIALSALIGDVT